MLFFGKTTRLPPPGLYAVVIANERGVYVYKKTPRHAWSRVAKLPRA